MEAEFVASSLAVTDVVWIKEFLANLKLEVITHKPIQLLCNNQIMVYTLKYGEISSKGKHIEIHVHFIFDILKKEKLVGNHIPTSEMFTDSLTKALTMDSFQRHVHGMVLRRN